MSKHDCRLSGVICLKDGVGLDEVRAAFAEFLDSQCLRFEDLVREDELSLDEGGYLYLGVRFFAYGGYQNDDVDGLARALAGLSEDGEYFEVFDYDTGDDDARCTPYFLANPEKGKVEYGIMQMMDWVRPVVGEEKFASIVEQIRSAVN